MSRICLHKLCHTRDKLPIAATALPFEDVSAMDTQPLLALWQQDTATFSFLEHQACSIGTHYILEIVFGFSYVGEFHGLDDRGALQNTIFYRLLHNPCLSQRFTLLARHEH